jgi:predicted methyltransferase
MNRGLMGPLLTLEVNEALLTAVAAGQAQAECSLDLERSRSAVFLGERSWSWQGQQFPYLQSCRERTIYYWTGESFEPASRFAGALFKLVPTDWGPPTFEIDGVKMLPSAKVSPYADAGQKVKLIQPRGRVILDTCGGLGYFAAWCLAQGAATVLSFEKSAEVIWLRGLNPWSPVPDERLLFTHGDVVAHVESMADRSVDAILHDPPRFGTAGELYSQAFYDQLARVLRSKGRLFHYTGTPNKLTTGRDVPNEVSRRLRNAGFSTQLSGDGVLATRTP